MIDWPEIPGSVKLVAAMQLLLAAGCIAYFAYFSMGLTDRPPSVFGLLALLKGFFFVAVAYGLLSLHEGWRFCVVVVAWFSVCSLPIYFLLTITSLVFANIISTMLGIESLLVIQLLYAIVFFIFVVTLYVVNRTEVIVVFKTHAQDSQLHSSS